MKLRSTIYSPNFGGNLTVVGTSFPAGTTLDEIDRDAVRPESAMLSSDGRHWIDGWHSGAESGEAVYVERHTPGGCVFHGFIDSVSRRIVQTG